MSGASEWPGALRFIVILPSVRPSATHFRFYRTLVFESRDTSKQEHARGAFKIVLKRVDVTQRATESECDEKEDGRRRL